MKIDRSLFRNVWLIVIFLFLFLVVIVGEYAGRVASQPLQGAPTKVDGRNPESSSDISTRAAWPSSPVAGIYYVAPNGDDSHTAQQATDISTPWKTIQKCASLAEAGNTCVIRAGTYRETVTPAHSGQADHPITFRNYPGDKVIINGCDLVTGWTRSSGNIYRTTTGIGYGTNQVFINGTALLLARTPNTDPDKLLQPTQQDALQIEDDSVSGFPDQEANYYKDAIFTGITGEFWVAQSALVVSSSGGKLMVAYKSSWWEKSKGTGFGYLEGKLSFLDNASEWYQDPSRVLYVWVPNGSDPAKATYEARRRDIGLDLRNKDYIIVQGLNFFATRASLDGASYSTLDGVSFDYVAVISRITNGWNRDRVIRENQVEGDGVWVSGDHNRIQNCQVNHSDGDGLTIMGSHNLVSRCWVRNTDLKSIDSASIFISGEYNTVEWSTFQDTARVGILHRGMVHGKILHNEIFNFGYLTVDLGATYDFNGNNAGAPYSEPKSEIAYNWIHDGKVNHSIGNGVEVGIYVDNDTQYYQIHHNVVWQDITEGVRINTAAKNINVFNNTFWGVQKAMAQWTPNYEILVYNNLSNSSTWEGNADRQKNLSTIIFKFAGSGRGGLYFRPLSNSPAVDYGLVIPGVTDGYFGKAPDAGAYEYGGSDAVSNWEAGYNGKDYDSSQ